MGHPLVETPNIDALAKSSAVFPNGYVPTSLCRASLATLLTGKYAYQHRICFNDPPIGIPQSFTESFLRMQTPVPEHLARQGYVSFQTGKFWEGAFQNGGFTEGMTKGERHGDAGLVIGRETMQPIDDFIARNKQDPMFIWYAPFLPHMPHDASEKYREKYENVGLAEPEIAYYANITWFDDTVGQLVELLSSHGVLDNTLIFFVVDNGYTVRMETPSYDRQGNMVDYGPRGKNSPYENGVRTPIFLHWPQKIKPAVYTDLVSTIDFVPSALAAAGTSKHSDLMGLNLLDRALGGPELQRDAVFGDLYLHTAATLDDPKVNVTHRWARKNDWKLIINHIDGGRIELFNLKDDPQEANNLAYQPAFESVIEDIRNDMDRWWDPYFDRVPT